jgi:6-phosphogluconolactonase
MASVIYALGGGNVVDFKVFSDRRALAEGAATHIIDLADQAIAARGQFTLALSGGSTPRRTYALLARNRFVTRVDWSRVHIFWGDERCVPPDHPASNYRMAQRTFLRSLPILDGNLHRMLGERMPHESAAHYASELDQRLGAPPRLDLVLLGLGEDGHTASLFPGTSALQVDHRPTAAVYVPTLGRWRITLTYPTINRARAVSFLVQGKAKAQALARVRDGELLPAGRVRPTSGMLTWFVDSEAARLAT